eukprot:10205575-Alexandrium_andersonii.AAC.1
MLVQSVQLGFSRCAGRATAARADPLHRNSLGPPHGRPQTGAVLWARALRQSDLGRRFAAPQVAV